MDINKDAYINHELCKAAITTIVSEIGKHPTIKLDTLGLDNDLVVHLGELSPREQHYVTSRARDFITFTVDGKALEQILSRATDDLAIYEQEDQFILLGATSRMMGHLFGLHTAVFSARRRRLNTAGKGSHRPCYCDEKTERYLWDLWEQHRVTEEQKTDQQKSDQRECYLKIAELSGEKLNVVWQAVQRYENGYKR